MADTRDRKSLRPPSSIDYEDQLDQGRVTKHSDAKRSRLTEFLLRNLRWLSFILGFIRSAANWFSRNHQGLSSLIVVIGLPATVFSLWLTREQMNAAQVNFQEEMAVQRKATAAVLINEFLKDVRAIEADKRFSEKKQKALEVMGVQAEFILQGSGDSNLRSLVLSYIAKNYSHMLKLVGGDTNVNMNGQVYTGEVSGEFVDTIFNNVSFPETQMKTVFDEANIKYSSFQGATFHGVKFMKAKLNCVSFSGAQFKNLSDVSFSGAVMRNVDLRGVTVGRKNRKDTVAILTSAINKAASLTNVFVDQDVKEKLTKISYPIGEQILSTKTDSSWIEAIEDNKSCG